jgi:nicotinate-nucleotide adenylyltransferase
MSRRIGVLGGMFDPVHTGHIEVAVAVQSQLQLDEVRLLPCAIPNHKSLATAGARHRVNMLRLAIEGLAGLLIDERELQREGTSYTVDTLEEMHGLFPHDCLVFIQGDDSFRTLPAWHQWHRLLEFAHICVMSRQPDKRMPASLQAPYVPALNTLLEACCANSAEELFEVQHGRIIKLDDVDNPVSSTQLREGLEQGAAFESGDWLAPAVLSYIRQHHLYRREPPCH